MRCDVCGVVCVVAGSCRLEGQARRPVGRYVNIKSKAKKETRSTGSELPEQRGKENVVR